MIRRLWESLLTFCDDHFAMISATEIVRIGVGSFLLALGSLFISLMILEEASVEVGSVSLILFSLYWGIFFFGLIGRRR